jgi:SAM-dependent methyltransferase
MAIRDEIRKYWDADAATYDNVTNHRPTAAAERAAWSTAMARLLPPAPARVLDCGAGTGFLSLLAARLGHRVTAVDLSPQMLARLRTYAEAETLDIDIVEGSADEPPPGPWDAVVERHVLWTLPDPVGALRAWRKVAPMGRLVLVEGTWGRVDPIESLRAAGRRALRRLSGQARDHHGDYAPDVAAALPLSGGTDPSELVDLVVEAGWAQPRLERLRDVEWAAQVSLPASQRLLGVPPRFVVSAGQPTSL